MASWRYTRGSRTLTTNLGAAGDMEEVKADKPDDMECSDEEDDDQDIPEQVHFHSDFFSDILVRLPCKIQTTYLNQITSNQLQITQKSLKSLCKTIFL